MARRAAWEPETGLTFREQLEEFEAQVKAQAKASVKEKRARGDSVEQIENRLPELNVESVVHAWRLKNDAWIEEVKAQVNAIVNEKHAQGESVEQIENRLHERKLELVGGEQKLSLVRRSNLGDVTNLVTNLGELKTPAAVRAEPSVKMALQALQDRMRVNRAETMRECSRLAKEMKKTVHEYDAGKAEVSSWCLSPPSTLA